MIYIFFQPGFESCTLENPENGTLLDYIESYIKIVKMEVTLTSTFLLGDLQYDVHTFQTRIWVQKHEFPQKWHPTWLYCTLFKIVKMEVTLTSTFYT